MANSLPVVLSSDQTAIPITVSGVATAANQTGGGQKTQIVDSGGHVLASQTPDSGTTYYLGIDISSLNGLAATSLNTPSDSISLPISGSSGILGTFNIPHIYTGSSTIYARVRQITNSINTTGTGISAAGILAQFDDVSPNAITENQFGNIRMSTNRNLYNTIRDAAGNERGANVNSSFQLSVSVDNNPVLGAGSAVIGHVITDSGSVTNATLSAETTKVIGVVRTSDGAGNLLTSNSTTYTAKFALDSNLLGTLGTAFSTAGKVDVKGADGDVFVRQATGTNLHMVVDSGTITTVSAVTAITNALPAGGNNIGLVTPTPTSNTGWSFNYQSALSSTKAQIKGSAGTFGGYINLFNPNTATTFIQVFNKTSANVTVGTTAPDFVITLPGIATASGTGSDRNLEITCGLAMNTGITIAATTTASGSSAPANAIVATFLFL